MSSHTSRFDGRVAQQVGRVEGRNQLRAAVVEDAAAQARDRIVRPQQRLRRELAERDDHLRLDDVDLPEQERLAGLDFVRLGIAVLRRPALDDVGDVDVVALEVDRLDDLRQQLAGAADERDRPARPRRRPAPRRRTSGRRSGLPTPNTICVRPSVCSLQRVQSPMSVGSPRAPAAALERRRRDHSRRRSFEVRWFEDPNRRVRNRLRPRFGAAESRLTPATPRSGEAECSAS